MTILTVSGWGKGGTTRAMLNLAEYLKGKHEIEIIGLWRIRDEPFFEHPEGVPVHAMEDLRPGHQPRGVNALLARIPSVLVHPGDRWSTSFSLLSDIRLVRRLRRRTGILITTRPALNLLAGLLRPPGLIMIGQEQMHLGAHKPELNAAMPGLYKHLDAFAVLTEGAREDYDRHLNGKVKLVRIPNSARELGAPADLDAKRVLAAGRLTRQKGFDWLIPAWAQVEAKHPDWKLRICGEGNWRERLEAQVAELGLQEHRAARVVPRHGRPDVERVDLRAQLALRGLPAHPLRGDEQGHGAGRLRLPDRARRDDPRRRERPDRAARRHRRVRRARCSG